MNGPVRIECKPEAMAEADNNLAHGIGTLISDTRNERGVRVLTLETPSGITVELREAAILGINMTTPLSTDEAQGAYDHGFRAARDGRRAVSNPYPECHGMYFDTYDFWRIGWQDGEPQALRMRADVRTKWGYLGAAAFAQPAYGPKGDTADATS